MEETGKSIPTQQEVTEIFNVTHNVFFKKWKNIPVPDWDQLHREEQEIYRKYPYQLCKDILFHLVKVIERDYLERREPC